ncbi:MAG: ABC transporter permease subunit [Planctomycetota bacterium]|nr:ABC transporter permease subunit [Planctomycetota bacterium]
MTLNRQTRAALFATLGYFVALELMLVAAILYWPSFRDNVGALRVLTKPIPMLNDMINEIEDLGAIAYVLGQHFFKGCNVLGCAAATLFAAGAIAGEANRGTLEILLARPISRRRLLLERWATGAVQVVLPIFLTTLTVPMLLARVDESVQFWPLMWCAAHQGLFLLSIYAVTFLMSTMGRTPLRITFVVLLLSIFQFSIYMVKTVTHYSLFRLADIQTFREVYSTAGPHGTWWLFLGVIGLCLVASLAIFERRVP